MNQILMTDYQTKLEEPDWAAMIAASLEGNRQALDALFSAIQPYIYNIALRMVVAPDDAEDITQEVLLKLATNLARYDASKSRFTTWVYAIVRNQVINMKTSKLEAVTESFHSYGEALASIPDEPMAPDEKNNPESQLLVKEANVGCMLGMLLCLEREQRLVYILGEILQLDHNEGATVCNTSPDNFRQRLHRARKELHNFMHEKCGLINKENPCRCHKKTRGFIKAGWVNPQNIQFVKEHYENQFIFSEARADALCDLTQEYDGLFKSIPRYNSQRILLSVESLLSNPDFVDLFQLDQQD